MGPEEVIQCPFVSDLIRHKARRMRKYCGGTSSDDEDLEQDLLLHLWKALPRFDGSRGCKEAFIIGVVELAAAYILRGKARQSKRDRAATWWQRERLGRDSTQEFRWFELREDVRGVGAGLDGSLRDLIERLSVETPSQIARDMDRPRSTLMRRIDRLREAFLEADLDEYR